MTTLKWYSLGITLVFLLLNKAALGEDFVDVIYLKDGSKIIGVIVEQIPNQSVRIFWGEKSVPKPAMRLNP